MVAFEGDPDDGIAETEGEEDLGRRRQQRDDPRRAPVIGAATHAW